MLDAVKDAFEMIWEEQKEKGWTDAEIYGMTDLFSVTVMEI